MKNVAILMGALFFTSFGFAGIFDGTPLDPRNPVEKCQDFVQKDFPSAPRFIATCGRITTDSAFKCLKVVSKNQSGLSKTQMNTYSFIDTKDSEKSLAVIAKQFPLTDEILLALTFTNTKSESKCVEGLVKRLTSISASLIMECNQESGWELTKRIARVFTM